VVWWRVSGLNVCAEDEQRTIQLPMAAPGGGRWYAKTEDRLTRTEDWRCVDSASASLPTPDTLAVDLAVCVLLAPGWMELTTANDRPHLSFFFFGRVILSAPFFSNQNFLPHH